MFPRIEKKTPRRIPPKKGIHGMIDGNPGLFG
jgi:hypothetical protein